MGPFAHRPGFVEGAEEHMVHQHHRDGEDDDQQTIDGYGHYRVHGPKPAAGVALDVKLFEQADDEAGAEHDAGGMFRHPADGDDE